MKQAILTIIAALLGLMFVYSVGYGQDAVPLTVETKTDDYVILDPKLYEMIAERGQSGEFVDWPDLMRRVSGVGPATIADMQAGGAILE